MAAVWCLGGMAGAPGGVVVSRPAGFNIARPGHPKPQPQPPRAPATPDRQTDTRTTLEPDRQTHTDKQTSKQTRREDKTANQRDERTPIDRDTHRHQERATDGQKRHPKTEPRDPRTQKPPHSAELIALR